MEKYKDEATVNLKPHRDSKYSVLELYCTLFGDLLKFNFTLLYHFLLQLTVYLQKKERAFVVLL